MVDFVDFVDFVDIGGLFGGLFSTMGRIVKLGLPLIFLVFLIYFIIFYFQHKHFLVIRKKTRSGDNAQIIKFRTQKDKLGIYWWQPLFYDKRKKINPPPQHMINLTPKGKMFAELQIDENGTRRWLEPHIEEDRLLLKQSLDADDVIQYAAELRAAEDRDKQGFLAKYGAQLFYGISIVLIIALVIFGYGDVVEPITEVGDKILKHEEQYQKNTLEIARLQSGVQQISSELGITNSEVAPP